MKFRQLHGALRWILIPVAIVGVSAAAFGALWFSRPLVTITRVVEGPAVRSFYATGTVEPETEYPIKAGHAGMITRIAVDKGTKVAKGDVLAVIDDPQLKYQVDKAAADLKQAQARADEKTSLVLKEFDAKLEANVAMLKNGRDEEKRLTEMQVKGGASQSDVDKASDHVQDLQSQRAALAAQREDKRLQLQADLSTAQASLAAANTDYERQTLRSPIDGVVLDRPTPLGTHLNINDHIMQVADARPENLRMRAEVDEENKTELKEGQLVRMVLYAFHDRVFDGHVSKIYPKADPDRRACEVDVMFASAEPKLSAGMTGELAFIVTEKKQALIAPAQALQHDQLFTIRDGRLTRIDAQVGIRSVERIEILSGLPLGDPIVISPVLDVPEGTRVRVKEIDAKVAAGLNKPSADSARNPLGSQ
jgi:HlyD family secretion protein